MVWVYIDVILVLIVAAPAIVLGAPALGYSVGGGAWILGRAGSTVIERRIARVEDIRRKLGLGLASSMGRVWMLAGAIIVVGITSTRANALTAALVIFGAFSLYFVRAAFGHMTQRRSTTR